MSSARKSGRHAAGLDDSDAESFEAQSQDGMESKCDFGDFEVDRETSESAEGPERDTIRRRRLHTKTAPSGTGYTTRPMLNRVEFKIARLTIKQANKQL